MVSRWDCNTVNFDSLVGEVITKIENDCDNLITFFTKSGREFRMLHFQDCCESVWIEDITGDLEDLVGEEVVEAREDSERADLNNYESSTWTFYTIRTNSTTVTIRWCGTSNGYYSESASFIEVSGRKD